ncbi:hypothetical protein [Colwellia sp. MEBiC06753]
MLSLSALFGIMMAPAIAVLMTSLVVRLFEQKSHENGSSFLSNFGSDKLN